MPSTLMVLFEEKPQVTGGILSQSGSNVDLKCSVFYVNLNKDMIT